MSRLEKGAVEIKLRTFFIGTDEGILSWAKRRKAAEGYQLAPPSSFASKGTSGAV